MKKLKIIIISLLSSGLAVVLTFFLVGYLKPEKAGLVIYSEPEAAVFVDNQEMGKTRYEDTRKPGEVVVRLVPTGSNSALGVFETKINLASGIKTIVKREFGLTDELSSGLIVSFEKSFSEEIGLAVVTMPDAAQVSIDGQVRGVSPYKNSNLTVGEHTLTVSAPGYVSRTETIQTYQGYKLTAVFKLKRSDVSAQPFEEKPNLEERQIKILSTSTGFLRVRSEPSTAATEIGQIYPGEIYKLVEEDLAKKWMKIRLANNDEGWVYSEYVEEVLKTPSATDSSSLAH